MYKILHVYPQLNCGGTEMVIYNLIRYSDHSLFQFDILIQKEGERDQFFSEIGCNLICIPFDNNRQYQNDIALFFSQHRYDAVHCHTHAEMSTVLCKAKQSGIPHCIAHSHTARTDIPSFLWAFRYLRNHKYEKYATDLLGCSEAALKWLFPTKWRSGIVLHNGIDLDSFQFDPTIRDEYRNRLGIPPDTKVLINIGRCTPQKNQSFILDRAKDLASENLLFVIIGEGPLLPNLQQRLIHERINNVRLLGKQLDVPNWLCAADAFIFPSIYEGLGIVAIEAQTNGLTVLSSDVIPSEADIGLNSLHMLSLKDAHKWNELITHSDVDLASRIQRSKQAYSSKYNIHNVVKIVKEIYQR